MSPIQQMLLGAGAVATKTYVDDVFSTFLYEGNETQNRSITNSIDLSGEGGLVWLKGRSVARTHLLYDTERGASKPIESSGDSAEWTNTSLGVVQFNNNGFNLGSHQSGNWDGEDFSSWTFRKAPGFFDVVTYTGTGSARTVDHNLGCVPGMIIIKRLDTADNWNVYHRNQHGSNSPGYYLQLNTSDSIGGASNRWNDTAPTATEFTVGTAPVVNANGDDFVAYVFAGGESTAATARSVDFDGSGDYLEIDTSSDFAFGTGDYTIEFWMYKDATGQGNIYEGRDGGNTNRILFYVNSNNKLSTYINASQNNSSTTINPGQWYHCALSRQGSTNRMFLNGTLENSWSDSVDVAAPSGHLWIGQDDPGSNDFNGKISNLRVVKGTAVYTSSFRPPTEPLTNITNTKLLCCNDSSITGSTVTPSTISSGGSPTASTDSPFDDPAGFVFGDAGDQNVIKCGSYVGTGSAGIEVNIGFEPQLILVKSTASGENWEIYDSMRGIVDGLNQSDRRLRPNTSDAEDDNPGFFSLRPNGFIVNGTSGSVNQNGVTFVFLAIRRPDGYVGKPPELGTGVFAMDTGNAAGTITPAFDSGFPVDFGFYKTVASSVDWISGSRLTGTKYMKPNGTDAETTSSDMIWDVNTGWQSWSGGTGVQAWMWKRHAGFDCIAFQGSSSDPGPSYAHGLGKIPELKIIKRRNASSTGWITTGTVVSQAIAGNNNSKDYYLYLNSDSAATNSSNYWSGNDTSTHFTVRHGNGEAGGSADPYLCLLFASTDVSKVGYYSGNNSGQTITTGFQPRFIIIRNTGSYEWFVFDTVRGWSQNNQDWFLRLDGPYAQSDHVNDRPDDIGHPLSTGFYLKGDTNNDLVATNKTGHSYIYYCHA